MTSIRPLTYVFLLLSAALALDPQRVREFEISLVEWIPKEQFEVLDKEGHEHPVTAVEKLLNIYTEATGELKEKADKSIAMMCVLLYEAMGFEVDPSSEEKERAIQKFGKAVLEADPAKTHEEIDKLLQSVRSVCKVGQ